MIGKTHRTGGTVLKNSAVFHPPHSAAGAGRPQDGPSDGGRGTRSRAAADRIERASLAGAPGGGLLRYEGLKIARRVAVAAPQSR